MKNNIKEPCPICKNLIDWNKEKTFIMQYNDPDQKKMISSILFFHVDCFIMIAGKEWANACGYDKV